MPSTTLVTRYSTIRYIKILNNFNLYDMISKTRKHLVIAEQLVEYIYPYEGDIELTYLLDKAYLNSSGSYNFVVCTDNSNLFYSSEALEKGREVYVKIIPSARYNQVPDNSETINVSNEIDNMSFFSSQQEQDYQQASVMSSDNFLIERTYRYNMMFEGEQGGEAEEASLLREQNLSDGLFDVFKLEGLRIPEMPKLAPSLKRVNFNIKNDSLANQKNSDLFGKLSEVSNVSSTSYEDNKVEYYIPPKEIKVIDVG